MAGAPMEKIIKAAVERGASDLHIKAGDVFRARIDGKLVPLTKQRLTPDQTRAIAARLLGGEDAERRLEAIRDYDCSWGLPGVGRFRINILWQRSSVMVVMRVVPIAVPTLDALGLPPVLQVLAEADRGLVLVAGMSASGKSSTVAAMVNHMNQHQQRHIIIIEDPSEFLHRDLNCSITQREVGMDTQSTEVGLRAALRQDPDVIVLGDLRDSGAVDLAIRAAETGRLVIGVMPSPGVLATVGQVLSILPEAEREIGRVRFAASLRAILAQQLVPRADGAGRVALIELLLQNPEVRHVLRDPGRLGELQQLMENDPGEMTTFARSAAALQEAGVISPEVARAVESR